MRFDLHIHSTASDGALAPSEVVRASAKGGLHGIALTDHDTTAGLAEARRTAEALGIEVIAGCELSSSWNGRDIHVLGYGVDVEAEPLRAHEARASTRRRDRMAEMVERLGEQGVEVRLGRVLEISGEGGVVGRPHLARALVEAGHAASVPQAFDTLIGDQHPAFVPTAILTPFDVVETIRASGGVAVWAHPPGDLVGELLPLLVEGGMQGLEVYRSRGGTRDRRRLLEAARERGLVVTGGSDWHDTDRNDPLGTYWVDHRQIEDFLELLGGPAAPGLPR